MSNTNPQKTMTLTLALATALLLASPVSAGAFEPSKWVLSNHIGSNVNKTKIEAGAPQEERNECTTTSKDECQPGQEGKEPRGFSYPQSVAVNPDTGDLYVSDKSNYRVQVLDPQGKFLFMFGWNVNKTKLAEGASTTQQEKNICTAASHDQCGAGESGTGLAGQLSGGKSLTIDPSTGNVYVLEREYSRVEEFTTTGEFILMIGGEVNKKGGNLCTKAEEGECQAGKEGAENSAFHEWEPSYGNLLAVGPQDHLLYVSDEGRVQKFEADGKWAGEIPLTGLPSSSTVNGVAVDKGGDVFVLDSAVGGVHEYDDNDVLQSCVIDPTSMSVNGIALDPYGRLGLLDDSPTSHGALYNTSGTECGKQVGGTIVSPSGEIPGAPEGLTFSFYSGTSDRLYVGVGGIAREVEVYEPELFPEVVTCPTEEVLGTSAVVCGEFDPNGLVASGFFAYGPGQSLGSVTPVVFTGQGSVFEPVKYVLTGLVPNETYSDDASARAEVQNKLETTGSQPVSFHTLTPPPEVTGVPGASDVSDAFALLSATVNPEHALTHYHFQYGPCSTLSGCAGVVSTADLESSLYGSIGTVRETAGLQPQTTYSFRLVADNLHEEPGGIMEGGETDGPEGHFTTAASPVPVAQTGGASGITATSAVISGTVDPDGQPAAYAFELGIYKEASTRYGVVFSGDAGSSITPVGESLALSGLQAGTTYAYRITVKSGYGESRGQTLTFTTEGLPAVLALPSVLGQLPVPSIAFPVTAKITTRTTKCKRGYVLNKQDKCVKSKTKAMKKAKKVKKASRTSRDRH